MTTTIATVGRLTDEDKQFITFLALPYFRIKRVEVRVSGDTNQYPDIQVDLSKRSPLIIGNQTWAGQKPDERRKRLVHEMLHIVGLKHNDKIGYNTIPAKDRFSWRVYQDIMQHKYAVINRRYFFSPRRFGLVRR